MHTIAVIALGFLVVYLMRDAKIFLYAAIGLLVMGCVPSLTHRIESLWMRLAHILGSINSRILLSIIFYLLLTSLALLRRLVMRPLVSKHGESATNFISRDHRYTDRDLINTW